jgi:hypothetical protein
MPYVILYYCLFISISNLLYLYTPKVKSFGVFFKEGAGDECAAAVAILLFGSTDTVLPGGYAGEEVSMDRYYYNIYLNPMLYYCLLISFSYSITVFLYIIHIVLLCRCQSSLVSLYYSDGLL